VIRVLLVDDSAVVRSIARTYLMGMGLDFDFAASVEEALERFEPPDLLITDFHMAGLTGADLARRLRTKAGRRGLKVLLISSDKELRPDELIKSGVIDAFLAKPLVREELCAAVSALVINVGSAAPPPSGPPSVGRVARLSMPPPSAGPVSERGRASMVPPASGGARRLRGPIRVLIADDTEVGRAILTRILRADPDLEVVATARDGLEAVELAAKVRPQICLLDAQMPELDGVAATRRIMAESPTRVIIVAEQPGPRTGASVFAATQAGALHVVARPVWGDPSGEAAVAFRDTIKTLAEVPVVRRLVSPSMARVAPRTVRRPAGSRPLVAIGICASTGGPPALAALLPALAPALDQCAVLIVQHVLAGFAEGLVDWLRDTTGIPVRLARRGDALRPGVVLVAPDDRHLVLTSRTAVDLTDGPAVRGHRPSGTPLFESMARHLGDGALGVVLTGMGDDGVEGLVALVSAGGTALAQSPDSCLIPSMPNAALARGIATGLMIDEIAREIVGRTRPAGAPSR
jgi:two-component system chemotaxis response regulator CheB